MINKVDSTPSFGSTRIVLSKLEREMPLNEIDKKFIAPIRRYFTLADINLNNDANFQKMADEIDFDKFSIHYKDGVMTFIGKDGGNGGADTFIGKTLKKLFPDRVKFTDDIKPVEVDGPTFELLV